MLERLFGSMGRRRRGVSAPGDVAAAGGRVDAGMARPGGGLGGVPEAAARPAGSDQAVDHRIWADRLWGEGFLLPGGAAEARRLCGLLPLSEATTLLLLGRDAGGVTGVAAARKSWISAYLEDPAFSREVEAHLGRQFGRRITRLAWNPEQPGFRPRYHDHALLIEPLRRCGPDRLLGAIAATLKAGGQLVLLDVVSAGEWGDRPDLARWMELEGRREPPPSEREMHDAFLASGFQIHVVEDAGARHGAAVLEAWAGLIGGMGGGPKPRGHEARALVAEAELWLLRQRLLQAGRLKLLRWHAGLRAVPERG